MSRQSENNPTQRAGVHHCPVCRQDTTITYLESHQDQGIEYTLHGCSDCKAQFWLPLKNPGSEWYERDERYAGANSDPTLEPNWNHRKVISFLKPFAGKVFDIGCGTGNFLAWAKKNSWEVWGIDFDRNAVNTSTHTFGLPNIEVANLESFYATHKNDERKFDLITFFDVFEHIDNHNEFLDMIKGLLAEKGHIAMSVPYRGGSRWLQPNDLPPRHLTRWNREALVKILERHGFTIRYIRRVPVQFFDIVMKVRFKYGKRFSFGLVHKVRNASRSADAIATPALSKKSYKVRLVHALAKLKDIFLFGIPAAVMWSVLLFSEKRYTGLYAIAQKN